MAIETDIQRIWADLEWLANKPRPAESDRLEECREYCEQILNSAGWQVERRHFEAADSVGISRKGINLVTTSANPAEGRAKFILGAHLDSRPETPGADDNASAVAVLLEVARLLGPELTADAAPSTPVQLELAVFDLEENGMLGGAFHAASCRAAGESVCGMVSLEMLGYCSEKPGSQTFPPELADRFPDTGNFIGIVGNQVSDPLIRHFSRAFNSVPNLPCESLQVPDNGLTFPPTRLSDHSPFWDEGFAALMITDTSFMRNPHYHLPSDTPETLDRGFLHNVAEGVLRATRKIVTDGLR